MTDDAKRTAMARLKEQRQREDELVATAAKAQAAVQKAETQLDDAKSDYDTAAVDLRDAMGLARTAEILGESEGVIRRKKAPATTDPVTAKTSAD